MYNYKLIKILQVFTTIELKEFRRFIESPFFNKEGSYLIRFFDELRKGYPEFTVKELEKEKLFISFAALALGDEHSCGLTSAGLVLCWGSDEEGQTDVPALSD